MHKKSLKEYSLVDQLKVLDLMCIEENEKKNVKIAKIIEEKLKIFKVQQNIEKINKDINKISFYDDVAEISEKLKNDKILSLENLQKNIDGERKKLKSIEEGIAELMDISMILVGKEFEMAEKLEDFRGIYCKKQLRCEELSLEIDNISVRNAEKASFIKNSAVR